VNWKPALGSLLVAGCLVLAGCSQTVTAHDTPSTSSPKPAGHPPPKVPVTSAQMAAIVVATMTLNNAANKSLDLRLLRSYESGSALAIDAASYTESAAVPSSTCSYPPFGIKVLSAVAEVGSSYPQRFVVLGSSYPLPAPKGCPGSGGSCPDADSIFEFERAAPGAPWEISLEPSADTGDVVHLSAGGGAAEPLSPTDVAAATALPRALAADLEHYEATGTRGPLQASYFTGSCWLIPDPRAAFEQYRKSGVNAHQVYSPASDQVSIPITDGGALTMFTLDFETTLLPGAAGGTIDWVSLPAAEPVTALLASGQYSRVVEQGALQVAAVTGSGGRFSIIGAYDSVTSVSGTKGTPNPGSGSSGGGVLVSFAGP
jgi:hypothetical protein